MQDFSANSASDPDSAVPGPGREPDEGGTIAAATAAAAAAAAVVVAETGRRLWYQLVSLAAIGVFSFTVLVSQLVGAESTARKVLGERDQAVLAQEVAKRQIGALTDELTAAKAVRAEQIIATDKDVRRIDGEVAALKAQRTSLTNQIDELGRRKTEAEGQLAAARAELAAVQTQVQGHRRKTPRPAHVTQPKP